MDKNDFLAYVNQAHQKGIKEAKSVMPEADVAELIQLIVDVVKGQLKPLDAAIILAKKYEKPVSVYLDVLAKFTIEETLKHTKWEPIQKLGNEEFASNMMNAAKKAAKVVNDYVCDEISEEELFSQLGNINLDEIISDVLAAFEIDQEKVNEIIERIVQTGWISLSYYALTEAYQILLEAKNDERVQHDERIRIEAECAKSIEMILSFRKEMNSMVSTYLSEYHETFEKGFKSMDDAILKNDVHGYIKGNVMIQEVLGYEIQFTNEEEFNDLMDSDRLFKL